MAQAEGAGKVLSAVLDDEDDMTVYSIEMLRGNYVWEIEIDARNGKVLENEEEDKQKNEPDVSIERSIERALQVVSGRVVEATWIKKKKKDDPQLATIWILREDKLFDVGTDLDTHSVNRISVESLEE